MVPGRSYCVRRFFLAVLLLVFTIATVLPLRAAEKLEQVIAAAKHEGELVMMSGAFTFGGAKAFAEIQAAFNNKYGLKAKIKHVPGPSFGPMTGRVLTEFKAGRKSSTDVHLGDVADIAALVNQNAMLNVNWSGLFPWITKEMEIVPSGAVLITTSLGGIIYNPNLIPKDKAPKMYEDLVDSRLNSLWRGKMAIPPYTGWLAQLASQVWRDKEKTLEFTRKIVAQSGGRIRYNEEERIITGEFPLMANHGSSVSLLWKWQPTGAPIGVFPGSSPIVTSYHILAVPAHSARPNMGKLFTAFMASQEGQAIVEKYDFRASHLVDGTKTAKYVKENRIKLLDTKESIDFFLHGGGLELQEEFGKILR